jgi:hypothetical protein
MLQYTGAEKEASSRQGGFIGSDSAAAGAPLPFGVGAVAWVGGSFYSEGDLAPAERSAHPRDGKRIEL